MEYETIKTLCSLSGPSSFEGLCGNIFVNGQKRPGRKCG